MDRGGQNMTDAKVDAFLARPGDWRPQMQAVRVVLLDCGLVEALKWGQPCYLHDGANLAILGGFKTGLRLTFFKGALLADPAGLLQMPGENTRSGRYLNFTTLDQIAGQTPAIRDFVAQAMALQTQGVRVDFAATPEPDWPSELLTLAAAQPAFRAAFLALTPGRRRYWLLHFGQAKQSATRTARIQKAMDRIFDGKGMNEV